MSDKPKYLKDERKDALKFIVADVVREMHSTELLEVIHKIDAENDDFTTTFGGLFCDRFDLGEWFVDHLVLNDIEVRDELEEIYNAKVTVERDSSITLSEALETSRS